MLRRLIGMLKREEAGFTLIELMIVILVILILAAILVPQFGLAQERARKAKCVSNQRNIETAVAMWATDNTSTNYVGNTMDLSTPDYGKLTGTGAGNTTQYTTPGAFTEPDTTYAGSPTGVEYYLSMGDKTGGTSNPAAPSYGHVACAADKTPDPWVNSYDGNAGTLTTINHTRGAAASP